MNTNGFTIRPALPTEMEIILHQRRAMFRDMEEGTVEELDRMVEVARPWLSRALDDKTYHHWLALDASGEVAGVAVCCFVPGRRTRKTPVPSGL
jgi:hypothetical protein